MVDVTASSQRCGSARLDGGGTVAYCLSGSGPPLVVVPGWLSHLELDWAVSAVRAFHLALATGRTLVRYDRPGCGLSEPYEGSRSIELEVAAIRAVTQAVGADRFDLLGWSLGAPIAATWAALEPGTVERLVLYGGWADGSAIGDTQSRRHVLGLVGSHWGLGSDLLTNLFAPDADAGTRRALAQYQRESSSADTAVALLRLAYELDVRKALPEVLAPTLVLHRGGDRAAPIAQGQALADGIPSATFVALDGGSHLPAFGDAQSVVRPVRRFLGLPGLRRAAPVGLTQRQMEVAALVANGLTNAEIGRRLHITERSAESHLERVRIRLGFRSRAQVAAWFVTQEPSSPQVR